MMVNGPWFFKGRVNRKDMISASLEGRLRTAGINPQLIGQVKSLARLSIRLTVQPDSGDANFIASSHLGGQPDLPKDMAWPDRNGIPMSFIAQIRLEQIASLDPARQLPSRGLLSFFYDATQQTYGTDPQDRGGWLAIYLNGEASTWQPRALPPALPAEARFSPHPVLFHTEITLPVSPSQVQPGPRWSLEDIHRYEEFLSGYPTPKDRGAIRHRMFGYPDQIQDDMQLACALASNGLRSLDDPRTAGVIQEKGQWMLLLQVDSDERLGMRWGSAGRIFYWIEISALQNRRFDQTWLILQSD